MRIGMTMAMPVVGQRFPLPTQMGGANLVLWLRADQGVTRSSASVPNTPATWTVLTNLTRTTTGQVDPAGGSSAILYTDSVDGAPTQHYTQNAVANIQTGPGFCDIWAKSGTITQLLITHGWSGAYTVVQLTTGALPVMLGNWTVRLLEGSWGPGNWVKFRLTIDTAIAGTFMVMSSKANNANYQGDGLGTFWLGTGATYGPTVTQDRVSQWNDQSGNGNNATQATAGSQPLLKCYDAAGNWVPYGQGGACEIGWPLDSAGKSVLLPAAFRTAFTGNGAPMTIIELRKILSVPSANTTGGLHLTTTANGTQILNNYNTPARLHSIRTDDASVAKAQTSTSAYTTGSYQSLAFVYDGTNGRVYQGGAADASNPTDLDVGTETPSAALLYAHNSVRREYVVYKTALADTYRKRVENGVRVRCGMAPI